MVKYEINTKEFKLVLEKVANEGGLIKMEFGNSEASFKFKEFVIADELYKHLLEGFYENSSS